VGLSFIYSTVKPKLVKSKGNDTTFIKVPIKRRSTSANDNPILHLMGNSGTISTALIETLACETDGGGDWTFVGVFRYSSSSQSG
jgi:hypothetical protein